MNPFNFYPAASDEKMVFGASRPGYPSTMNIANTVVSEWMDFMESQDIKAVCCLLGQDQLCFYQNSLLTTYEKRFGKGKICSAPITDYTFADEKLLATKILPFISASIERGEKVVVHCSAGIGRTGQVLAAWLVNGRGLTNQEAVEAVGASGAQRNLYKASGQNTLESLLDACRMTR